MIMKTKNYFQLAALTLGMAMTVIMSSCAKEDNPAANVPYDTTGPVINLSELTDANVPLNAEGVREILVMDGQTLTGRLHTNLRVRIADGATVTLDNVNINGAGMIVGNYPGLTLTGSAHIIMPDNTVNKVRGLNESMPAFLLSVGSTVTIEGAGALNLDLMSTYSTGIDIDRKDVGSDTPIVGSGTGTAIINRPLCVVNGRNVYELSNIRIYEIWCIEVLR